MLIPGFLIAQKIYIWCPSGFEAKPRAGLMENDTINVVIFDGRIIPKKSKIECTPEQLGQTIFNQLKTTYPSAVFNLLPESDYHKKFIVGNSALLKVGISAYHAGFGSDVSSGVAMINGSVSTVMITNGHWNGLTTLSAQIFSGSKSESKDISHTASRPNSLGFSSAKKALNMAYTKSIQDLLFFMDQQLGN